MAISKNSAWSSVVDLGAGLSGLTTLANGSTTTGTATNSLANQTNRELVVDIFLTVGNGSARTAGARLVLVMETSDGTNWFEWEQTIVLGGLPLTSGTVRFLYQGITIPPGQTRIKSVTNNTGQTLNACTIEGRTRSVEVA